MPRWLVSVRTPQDKLAALCLCMIAVSSVVPPSSTCLQEQCDHFHQAGHDVLNAGDCITMCACT